MFHCFHDVQETVAEPASRLSTIHEVIRNPHSGLSRTEANYVISTLFNLEAFSKRNRYSFTVTKADHDGGQHDLSGEPGHGDGNGPGHGPNLSLNHT